MIIPLRLPVIFKSWALATFSKFFLHRYCLIWRWNLTNLLSWFRLHSLIIDSILYQLCNVVYFTYPNSKYYIWLLLKFNMIPHMLLFGAVRNSSSNRGKWRVISGSMHTRSAATSVLSRQVTPPYVWRYVIWKMWLK